MYLIRTIFRCGLLHIRCSTAWRHRRCFSNVVRLHFYLHLYSCQHRLQNSPCFTHANMTQSAFLCFNSIFYVLCSEQRSATLSVVPECILCRHRWRAEAAVATLTCCFCYSGGVDIMLYLQLIYFSYTLFGLVFSCDLLTVVKIYTVASLIL